MRKDYINSGAFLRSLPFWIILGSIVFLFFFVKSCEQNQDLKQIPSIEYKTPDKTYQDEKGNQHTQQTAIEVTQNLLDKMVDSLLSENKNLKNALFLAQATTKIDTVWQTSIVYTDSTKTKFNIGKKDDWIDLQVKGDLKTGESSISLKTYDTLSIVAREHKRLLKSNQTIIDISHTSPYQKTESMRSFTVSQKKSILVFGPQVSYSYNGKEWKPTVGVGMTLNLFSIKTKK